MVRQSRSLPSPLRYREPEYRRLYEAWMDFSMRGLSVQGLGTLNPKPWTRGLGFRLLSYLLFAFWVYSCWFNAVWCHGSPWGFADTQDYVKCACTRAHVHDNTQRTIHTCMHTCMHPSTHPCIHASMHGSIHSSTHPCMDAHIQFFSDMCTGRHTCAHTCIHACMHETVVLLFL